MNKFIGKSICRKFVKNANERGHTNSKDRPPGNSETRTDSAIVYKRCFMQIRFMFSTVKKIFAIGPPQWKKFGVIDTPQNFEVEPLISLKRIEDPQFFQLCIKRSDIGQTANL